MQKKTVLNDREKIALAAVEVLGRDYLTTAFKMCHPRTSTTSENSLKVMVSRWYASDLCKAFRDELADRLAHNVSMNGADLRTREGIVQRLISATASSQGKDELNGLVTLAKLQGYDRPQEESIESEKRTFFLPWVSRCKNCALMKLYKEVQNKE